MDQHGSSHAREQPHTSRSLERRCSHLLSRVVFNDAAATPSAATDLHCLRSTSPKQARWLLHCFVRRLTCRVVLPVCLVLAILGYLIYCAVQFSFREGPSMDSVQIPPVDSLATQLSPSLKVQQLPFLDLCQAAEVVETRLREPPQRRPGSRGSSRGQQRRAELEGLMDRLNHIPADGGPSAVRWSAATGLPVARERQGEVKARFLTASSKLDDYVHIATTAATMAGVRFEFLGHNWQHFSYLKRLGLMLSYVQHEGLSDADVIVGLDSDALLSGEDMYGFLEAFVASTAETEAEHRAYAVRDIRLGRRLPPFLFGAEFNCMREQVVQGVIKCQKPYEDIDALMASWATKTNVTLQLDFVGGSNPLRFLNTGVFVARVWAVKLWNTAFLGFLKTHKPTLNEDWWCDQSAMGTIYLELRLWELLSGALDGPPQPLSPAQLNQSFYPPLVLSSGQSSGPHGMPAGLIGFERTGRLVLTVGPEMSGHGVFQVDGVTVPRNNMSDVVLEARLHRSGWELETSLTGVVQSTHRLHVTPRERADCHGVAQVGPECVYRDAVLGLPANSTAVTPLMWHFAGEGKRAVISHYRGLFPWYTPAIQDAVVRNALLWTLVHAPPTRVYAVNASTDTPLLDKPVLLLPHRDTDDKSFFQLCTSAFMSGGTSHH